MIILGFSGRAKHGKTDCCEAIVGHVNGYDVHGYICGFPGSIYVGTVRARIYDIGDMIRRYCIKHGKLPQIERRDMNREQLEILINVGREQRAVDVNFWIGQLFAQIVEDNPEVALCPNIRYWNEAEAVHAHGGYVVRCTRLNPDGSTFISEDRPANDPSETALEFWPADYYLTSKEGQLGWICEQAITLYEYLKGLSE